MDIPIYLDFEEFKTNYQKDLSNFLRIYPICKEEDYIDEQIFNYEKAQSVVTMPLAQEFKMFQKTFKKIVSGGFSYDDKDLDAVEIKLFLYNVRETLIYLNTKLDPSFATKGKKQSSEPEPFNEKEKGFNVPYKIAMLDEMGILKNLKIQYPNETDIIKILHYLVGGNIDNVKKYFNSIYGNYSGSLQITPKHREHSKQTYYK